VQVWRFKLQHCLDSLFTNLLPWLSDVVAALFVAETSLDEFLAVLDEEVVDDLVTYRGDLDEFGETVSDLSDGKGLEEGEVEEGVERGVVCSESLFISIRSNPEYEHTRCQCAGG
jgi:hypothetical protein